MKFVCVVAIGIVLPVFVLAKSIEKHDRVKRQSGDLVEEIGKEKRLSGDLVEGIGKEKRLLGDLLGGVLGGGGSSGGAGLPELVALLNPLKLILPALPPGADISAISSAILTQFRNLAKVLSSVRDVAKQVNSASSDATKFVDGVVDSYIPETDIPLVEFALKSLVPVKTQVKETVNQLQKNAASIIMLLDTVLMLLKFTELPGTEQLLSTFVQGALGNISVKK